MAEKCPTCGAPAGPAAPDGDFRYRPPAPSDYLSQPTRSAEAAALDVAVKALRQAKIKMLRIAAAGMPAYDEAERTIDKALTDIAALLAERGR